MNITKDKLVSLAYELRIDGTNDLVEKLDSNNPLKFISGAGYLLPEFEQQVEGMVKGDKFNFVLKSENAYGPIDPKAIIDIERSVFTGGEEYTEDFFELGKLIPMMTKSGQRVDGKIIGVTAESIKMDFNHPMAGKDLNFSGYVVDVSDSTDEDFKELYGGHDCGSGGCESCGGSCS
jgi:FKBP-type peptidyl-prolyl cis-trans isomerase SlyD